MSHQKNVTLSLNRSEDLPKQMISWLLNKFTKLNPLPSKGVFLGFTSRGRQHLILDDRVLRSHVVLSGQQAAGSRQLITHMLTQYTEQGRGWIHFDTSADDTWRNYIANVALNAGRLEDFYVLDLVDPGNSYRYDVLRAGTASSRAQRVLALFPEVDAAGATWFQDEFKGFLTALFDALDAAGKSAGLVEVAALLTRLGSPEAGEQLLTEIPDGHPARATLAEALLVLSRDGSDARRLMMVAGSAAGRLAALACLPGSAVFNHERPELDFEDVLAGGKMCLVRLPPLTADEPTMRLASMMLQDICAAMQCRAAEPGKLPAPFLVALESFPEYGLPGSVTAPTNGSTWSQARGLNISMVQAVGGYGDASARDEMEMVTANALTKVYFAQEECSQRAAGRPPLAAGTLSALLPGEFMLCNDSTVVRGTLAYTHIGTSLTFRRGPQREIAALPRLALSQVVAQ